MSGRVYFVAEVEDWKSKFISLAIVFQQRHSCTRIFTAASRLSSFFFRKHLCIAYLDELKMSWMGWNDADWLCLWCHVNGHTKRVPSVTHSHATSMSHHSENESAWRFTRFHSLSLSLFLDVSFFFYFRNRWKINPQAYDCLCCTSLCANAAAVHCGVEAQLSSRGRDGKHMAHVKDERADNVAHSSCGGYECVDKIHKHWLCADISDIYTSYASATTHTPRENIEHTEHKIYRNQKKNVRKRDALFSFIFSQFLYFYPSIRSFK